MMPEAEGEGKCGFAQDKAIHPTRQIPTLFSMLSRLLLNRYRGRPPDVRKTLIIARYPAAHSFFPSATESCAHFTLNGSHKIPGWSKPVQSLVKDCLLAKESSQEGRKFGIRRYHLYVRFC